MTLEEDFKSAQERVQKLASRPGTDELLELYALFKQATLGNVTGPRPGMLDLKARAKFDAWTSKSGMTKEAAMGAYVAMVARLEH
jgi:diazepam-binding inhibitor (GABA receptor modulator, acyl-CoA-binding protein)